MFAKTMTVIGLLTGLSACAGGERDRYQTGIREPISLRDDGDECGSTLVQTYVGLRANQTVREEVTRRSGASSVRWIEPGMAVTMDHSPTRLNAELDEDGVVVSLRCG
ncbi:MAG: I78 family peptidase inhibitor [Sphingopyxis sp.]